MGLLLGVALLRWLTMLTATKMYYLRCAGGRPHPNHHAGTLEQTNLLGDKLDGRGYPGPHTEASPCGPHSTIGIHWTGGIK